VLIEHDMGVVMDISDGSSCSTTDARSRTVCRKRCGRIQAVIDAYLGGLIRPSTRRRKDAKENRSVFQLDSTMAQGD
jgi:hypothetical protein